MMISIAALAMLGLTAAAPAQAFELGVIGFQFTSETHARVANAVAAAAKAKGWNVTLLNSEGSLPKHAEQFDALVSKKVDAIIIAMGKPVEADAQFKAAKDKGIPVITVQSGASPHALFDIQTNEYKIGAEAALYLLGQLGYRGNIVTARFDLNVASRIRGKLLDDVLAENQAVKEIAKFSMARTQSWRDDVRAGMQALLLQNQGKINGIWASFDGQAYIIDDPACEVSGRRVNERLGVELRFVPFGEIEIHIQPYPIANRRACSSSRERAVGAMPLSLKTIRPSRMEANRSDVM